MKREAFMGEADLTTVRLTERERATLRRASEILSNVREARGPQFDDDAVGVDIALASYVCEEIAQAGEVEA